MGSNRTRSTALLLSTLSLLLFFRPAHSVAAPAAAATTGPAAADAAAKAARAALSASVDRQVKVLLEGSDDERQVAEDSLQNLPPEAAGLIEAAAGRPGLDPDPKKRLAEVVARRKPLDAPFAARRKANQQEYEWNLRTALDAYERAGTHDPKWDETARTGIRQLVSLKPSEKAAALGTLQHACADLGCNDPLVLYMFAHALDLDAKASTDLQHRGRRAGQAVNAYGHACQGFEKSAYPAYRKSVAFTRAVALIYACAAKDVPQIRADAKKWSDEALALWPEVVKEPGITAKLLTDAGNLTVEAQVLVGADRGTVTDQMFDALDKAMPGSATSLTFMGKQYIDWAWDARGGGFANTVTRDGWTKFSERLTTAEDVLTKAYDRDPADPTAATKMITVELGQGRGRDVMEKWFKRAVAADPDHIEAYDAKLYYLQPKWHGSVDEALGFARECVATRDWRGGIPMVMIRAHKDLARYAQNEEAYWRQPEVWKDLESAVEPPTRIWPDSANYRSIYAYWAWRCGQWKRADAQFKTLGDKLDPAPWGSRETAEKAREEAAQRAAGG